MAARSRAKKKARQERNGVQFLTPEQSGRLFDRVARRRLGISGEEFIRRWKAGFGKDPDSVPGVIDVWVLMPPLGS